MGDILNGERGGDVEVSVKGKQYGYCLVVVAALLAWSAPAVACCAAMAGGGEGEPVPVEPATPPCHGPGQAPGPGEEQPEPCQEGPCQCVMIGCQARQEAGAALAGAAGATVAELVGPAVALSAAVSEAVLPATYFDRGLSFDTSGAMPPVRTLVAQNCQLTL